MRVGQGTRSNFKVTGLKCKLIIITPFGDSDAKLYETWDTCILSVEGNIVLRNMINCHAEVK